MTLVNGSSICNTAACQNFSAQVLQSLASNFTKINACENWDQLVCGGYRGQEHLPPNERKDSVFSKIRADVNTALSDIILSKKPQIQFQDGEAATAEKENWILVKTSYNVCMDDLKTQQTWGYFDLHSESAVGKFFHTLFEPNTNDSMSPSADVLRNRTAPIWGMDELVEQALTRMSTRALNAFVSFGPAKSLLNPNQTILAIQPDLTLGMPPKFYEDKKFAKRYRDLIAPIVERLAPRNLQRRLGFNADKILWYEHRQARRLPPIMDYTDIHRRKNVIQVPLRKLRQNFYYIPMRQILETYPWPKGYELTDETMVELINPQGLFELNMIFSTKKKNEKLAFMFWKVFLKTQDLWNFRHLKKWKEFQTEVGYREPGLTDHAVCLKRVYSQFPDLLDALYVQKHFSQAEKAAAGDILHQVKQEYFGLLNSTTWMSPTARKLSVSKAADIVELVGFKGADPNILDPISLQKYHNAPQYQSKNSSYIEWYFDVRQWRLKKEWEAFAKPPPAEPWHLAATAVNAIYSPAENSITLPAAMLRSPIFDARLPSVVNYAGFGSIAAHEFTHALDDNNRHFNEEGVIKGLGWEKSDERNYKVRAKCFKKLYNGKKAEPGSAKVHGGAVLGEAIADSYGADIAYNAWKASKGPHHERLVGLEKFTADQLFWILRSVPFCDAKEEKLDKVRAKYDPHPPKKLRTWLPLKNSKEWHESFGCEMKEPVCELFGA